MYLMRIVVVLRTVELAFSVLVVIVMFISKAAHMGLDRTQI